MRPQRTSKRTPRISTNHGYFYPDASLESILSFSLEIEEILFFQLLSASLIENVDNTNCVTGDFVIFKENCSVSNFLECS